MSNSKMFLFWSSGSMPAWRPKIVLAEKGLLKGLAHRLVSYDDGEHKCKEIMKLNPRGQVPTFTDGDVVVNESVAICMHLENNYSNDNNRLIPNDPVTQAKMFQRIFECENVMAKVIDPIAYSRFLTDQAKWNTKHFETAKAELKLWNDYLEGAEYLAGSSFSMADVVFFPYLALLVRLGVKFETNKNLTRYHGNICKRPSVQESWPPHWPENPSSNTLADFVA